jgi:hypothetical protein
MLHKTVRNPRLSRIINPTAGFVVRSRYAYPTTPVQVVGPVFEPSVLLWGNDRGISVNDEGFNNLSRTPLVFFFWTCHHLLQPDIIQKVI